MLLIRKLQPSDDRMAIGRIYEVSWKFAYKELLPQKYLDNLSADQWANMLDMPNRHSLIAELGGKMIGIASYGGSRDIEDEKRGEIYSIYLLPQYIGNSYGKHLISAVIAQLQVLGYKSIFLWVLKDNLRARRFYEKTGFVCSNKSKKVEIGGKTVTEVQYIITDD